MGRCHFAHICRVPWPPALHLSRFCMYATLADAAALLRLVALNNEQMPREINIDITYDSDLICMWVVYQGSQADVSHLLAPLLQAPTSPALVARLLSRAHRVLRAAEALPAVRLPALHCEELPCKRLRPGPPVLPAAPPPRARSLRCVLDSFRGARGRPPRLLHRLSLARFAVHTVLKLRLDC